MYVPQAFEEQRLEVLHGLIRDFPLGALIVETRSGLEANHIPFLLAPESGPFGTLRGHVARANAVSGGGHRDREVLVIFQGPNAYISPEWLPSKRPLGMAVPTWNYAIVHAYGELLVLDDSQWLRAHVEALTDRHESGRERPWHVSDAPAEFTERLLGAVVGVEVRITRLVGKWKLSQNRQEADRIGVAEGLKSEGSEAAIAVGRLVKAAVSDKASCTGAANNSLQPTGPKRAGG